jgi:LysM repeat protein
MFYRVWTVVRVLIILVSVAAIVGALVIRVSLDDYEQASALYDVQVTVVVGTAIADALNNATRTAEAPLSQYRLIAVDADESLADVAERYQTTVEVIRMANGLSPDVSTGDGGELIVPEGLPILEPARSFEVYRARDGDTLEALATQYGINLRLVLLDNPVLARRGVLLPGDIVYIPQLL